MPIGTPHISTTAPQPHVRVIPRAHRDLADAADSSGTYEDQDYLPTYCTPSLQFSAGNRGTASPAALPQGASSSRPSDEGSTKTTFADMTRRPGRAEQQWGGRAYPRPKAPSPSAAPGASALQGLSRWGALLPNGSDDEEAVADKENTKDTARLQEASDAARNFRQALRSPFDSPFGPPSETAASGEASQSYSLKNDATVILSSTGNNSIYSEVSKAVLAASGSPEKLSPGPAQRGAHENSYAAGNREPTPTMNSSHEQNFTEDPSSITAKYDRKHSSLSKLASI